MYFDFRVFDFNVEELLVFLAGEDALDTRNHLAAVRTFLANEITNAFGADRVSARS